MPDPNPHPRAPSSAESDRPSDELILAALERAARHQARDSPAVPVWAILEHLAVSRRSGASRHVSSRLAAMQERGWLERSRRHGVITWALTRAGARRLHQARRAGTLAPLPEAPQHRAWRLARVAADQEIGRFRSDLSERLDRAAALAHTEPPPHSDVWLALAEELQRACRRLASATYCLLEWAEPDDAQADVDEHLDPTDEAFDAAERARRRARRAGRRNIRLWEDRR